jgi:hypothetical protein
MALVLFTALTTVAGEKNRDEEEKIIPIPLQFSDLKDLLQLRLINKDLLNARKILPYRCCSKYNR